MKEEVCKTHLDPPDPIPYPPVQNSAKIDNMTDQCTPKSLLDTTFSSLKDATLSHVPAATKTATIAWADLAIAFSATPAIRSRDVSIGMSLVKPNSNIKWLTGF